MNYILGVDIGTQGNKGVILNENLESVAKIYMEHDYFQPRSNWYEHDAEKIWWGGFKQVIQHLLICRIQSGPLQTASDPKISVQKTGMEYVRENFSLNVKDAENCP